MAGITKAERERRRDVAEVCDHPREHISRWHRYPAVGDEPPYWGKRVTCLVCRSWWVVDDPTYRRLYVEPYEQTYQETVYEREELVPEHAAPTTGEGE